MRLVDKVALITGASKGIGRALALGLAREGAHVAVNFQTDQAGAESAAQEIVKLDRESIVVQADIARVDQVSRLFKAVSARFGRLDVLVNNAAVTGWGDLFAMTEADWDLVVDTNLKGTFFCCQQAARLMLENGGSIINVSTNCAELGVKNLAAYAASKGGIHALTKQLAVELAPHRIRVNTLAPGPTVVDRNLRDDPRYDESWGRVVPLGRAARPDEMVGAAVFFASEESSFVTGQLLFVDGGWTVAGRLPADYFEAAARQQLTPSSVSRPR